MVDETERVVGGGTVKDIIDIGFVDDGWGNYIYGDTIDLYLVYRLDISEYADPEPMTLYMEYGGHNNYHRYDLELHPKTMEDVLSIIRIFRIEKV